LAQLALAADELAVQPQSQSQSSQPQMPPEIYSEPAEHRSDRIAACALAQNEGNQAQSRAQRAVNAARLHAAECKFRRRSSASVATSNKVEMADAAAAAAAAAAHEMVTWLETLPSKSTQNSVLCGIPVPVPVPVSVLTKV